jgi:hypothetical protein
MKLAEAFISLNERNNSRQSFDLVFYVDFHLGKQENFNFTVLHMVLHHFICVEKLANFIYAEVSNALVELPGNEKSEKILLI